MNEPSNPDAPIEDAQALASSLGPVLISQCGGKLGKIEWFRSTWQRRGAAATGYATWTTTSGEQIEAIVKLPVGPSEYFWTLRLGAVEEELWHSDEAHDLPTPRVLAAGEVLGGYDLAWLVIERLDGQPLAADLSKPALMSLINAAAQMQQCAMLVRPVDALPQPTDWERLLGISRDAIKTVGIAEEQRWNAAVKRTQKQLPHLIGIWEGRSVKSWCHGDLHPGNAMWRTSGAEPACVLIDLALMHPGHWVEDGVYLERQFWGHKDALHGIKPVSHLAKCRKKLGLSTEGNYQLLANVRRVLTAACIPVFLGREGNPAYVHAGLEVLEHLLPQITK